MPLGGGLHTCDHTHPRQVEAWACRDNQDEPDDWAVVTLNLKVVSHHQDYMCNQRHASVG